MQLNTLNSIRKRTVLNQLTLPKIGHRILHFHDHLFVFGGSRFQKHFNPIIHRLNTQTNQIQTLQVPKIPHLEGFALFQYGEFIYLWGGSSPNLQICNSQLMNNSLLQFDGSKFVFIKQSGQIPSPRCFFAYTLFLNRYLIIYGGFDCQVFYNTWHIMDLKDFSWKKINTSPQMPYSYRSTMKWLNGRGYILLQQAYIQKTDSFYQNLFYEFKFQNFRKLQLKITPIQFSPQILKLNVQFSNLCFVENNSLILFGGQKKFMKKHFSYHKNAVIYNYETLQWQLSSLDFQGSQFQSLYINGRLFIVGGIKSQTQMFPIQIFEFNKSSAQSYFKRQFENSQCYHCETAYSYKQNNSSFIVKCQFQPVATKNKIQNKFLWKFSQIYRSPFHAIGSILDWFINMNFEGIQISLRNSYIQKINSQLAQKIYNAGNNQNLQIFNFLKFKCYNQSENFLTFENIQNCLLKETDEHICQPISSYFEEQTQQVCNQQLHIQNSQNSKSSSKRNKFKCFFQLRLLCFRLGYSFLFVTFTKQNFIIISYVSCLQTQSPQIIHKKTSILSYTISWSKFSNKFSYSSQMNRHIIYQNIRHCFQNKQAYQQTFNYFDCQNKKNYFHKSNTMPSSLYIFDCKQLQKRQIYSFAKIADIKKRKQTTNLRFIQNFTQNYSYKYCDIVLKTISKDNPQNSLFKYLEALYLPFKKNNPKIVCENNIVIQNQSQRKNQEMLYSPIQLFFKVAEQEQKVKGIKLSLPRLRSSKIKNQHEQTHFTTMQDQNQIPIQNLDIFKSCSLYESILATQQYKGIFFYMNNRLVFVYNNSKFPFIQGIIQLVDCKIDRRTQLLINKCQFSSLETQLLIQKWLSSIQGFITERRLNERKISNQIEMTD